MKRGARAPGWSGSSSRKPVPGDALLRSTSTIARSVAWFWPWSPASDRPAHRDLRNPGGGLIERDGAAGAALLLHHRLESRHPRRECTRRAAATGGRNSGTAERPRWGRLWAEDSRVTVSGIPRPATSATTVLEHVRPGSDIIVQPANGEPVTVLDAIEAAAPELERVSVHQSPARPRPPATTRGPSATALRHVSYFLTPKLREHFERGTVGPGAERPQQRSRRSCAPGPAIRCCCSRRRRPTRHGYVSLGTDAAYGAALLGDARVFVEANRRMPRTSGRNQIHLSRVVGLGRGRLCARVPAAARASPTRDRTIAALRGRAHPRRRHAAGRHRRRARRGGGSMLADHRDLGIHTEFLAWGIRPPHRGRRGDGRAEAPGSASRPSQPIPFGSPDMYPFLDENSTRPVLAGGTRLNHELHHRHAAAEVLRGERDHAGGPAGMSARRRRSAATTSRGLRRAGRLHARRRAALRRRAVVHRDALRPR